MITAANQLYVINNACRTHKQYIIVIKLYKIYYFTKIRAKFDVG